MAPRTLSTPPAGDSLVAAITEIYAHASTFPCKIETQAGDAWVMKMRGSGPGPMALLTEFIALRAARAAGLAVPDTMPLYLPTGFPWTIGTDEFDGIVQRSYGWNLGVRFIEGARPATAEAVFQGDPEFLRALSDMDRALANMDRTRHNANVLVSSRGLTAIDFDACLFLRRALRGTIPDQFGLPSGHLCMDHASDRPCHALDTQAMIAALEEAPMDWIDSLGTSPGALAPQLIRYAEAWNAKL